MLYEKPDFQGRTIALEEGGIELSNMWGEPGSTGEPHPNPPMVIGSIRHVVWVSVLNRDLSIHPSIHVFVSSNVPLILKWLYLFFIII